LLLNACCSAEDSSELRLVLIDAGEDDDNEDYDGSGVSLLGLLSSDDSSSDDVLPNGRCADTAGGPTRELLLCVWQAGTLR
jgi:hypothetical protein